MPRKRRYLDKSSLNGSQNFPFTEDDEYLSRADGTHSLQAFEDSTSNEPLPIARNAANARERARMRVLSKAFCRLKTTLPWVPVDTKLSKLDTLRLATSYIAHLRSVLTADERHHSDDEDRMAYKHPVMMTWPFSFQKSDSKEDTCVTNCSWNTMETSIQRDNNNSQTIRMQINEKYLYL